MKLISSNKSFGGTTAVYEHDSTSTGTPMRFAIYLPALAKTKSLALVYWLSGLTCSEQNVIQKSGAQRILSDLNLIMVAPDTSPRCTGISGEEDDWTLGSGASFYVDATEEPWVSSYRMFSYVTKELPELIEEHFPVCTEKQSIFGHSMGGHGALVAGLRCSANYRSISAFAPIASAATCPWGERAFAQYLGTDRSLWQKYDACSLLDNFSGDTLPLLVDQGMADEFLVSGQLQFAKLKAVCARSHYPAQIREHDGYDHSFYFISTFMEDHLRFHAQYLC